MRAGVYLRGAGVVVGVSVLYARERQFKQSACDRVVLRNKSNDGRRVVGVFSFNQSGGCEES